MESWLHIWIIELYTLFFNEASLSDLIMVWEDPKLPYDNGKVPQPNEVVGSSISSREIVPLLDKN